MCPPVADGGEDAEAHFPLALTVEAGEVSPIEHGAVEGGQGDIEEQVAAIGRVPDGVGEQVHLQQGLDQIAQHLAAQRDLRAPSGLTGTDCLSICPFRSGSPSWISSASLLDVKKSRRNVLLILSWFKCFKYCFFFFYLEKKKMDMGEKVD